MRSPSDALPPLTLLAEPKRAPAAQISTEALEENAKLLESVLDDFGVRGAIINVRPGPRRVFELLGLSDLLIQ